MNTIRWVVGNAYGMLFGALIVGVFDTAIGLAVIGWAYAGAVGILIATCALIAER